MYHQRTISLINEGIITTLGKAKGSTTAVDVGLVPATPIEAQRRDEDACFR